MIWKENESVVYILIHLITSIEKQLQKLKKEVGMEYQKAYKQE